MLTNEQLNDKLELIPFDKLSSFFKKVFNWGTSSRQKDKNKVTAIATFISGYQFHYPV